MGCSVRPVLLLRWYRDHTLVELVEVLFTSPSSVREEHRYEQRAKMEKERQEKLDALRLAAVQEAARPRTKEELEKIQLQTLRNVLDDLADRVVVR